MYRAADRRAQRESADDQAACPANAAGDYTGANIDNEAAAVKISLALVTAALIAVSSLAAAHAHLKDAQPAEGSVMKAAPANIVLKFSEAARLTALTVQKEGEAEQKLAPLPNAAAAEASVPAPKLAPGKYVLSWRVVSDDNHIMSGKLHFTVDPNATPSAGKAPDHDHAH
jgi:methionine-rich copper-binding protein CopC